MSGRENIIAIVMAEAAAAASEANDWEGRIEAAMSKARNHWMTTDDDEQFTGAVGGLLSLAIKLGDHEMEERIQAEMRGIRSLSAAFNGVSINLEALKVPENPIGLIDKWNT